MIRSLLSFLLLTATISAVAHGLSPVTMTVDETITIKPWDPGIIGITFDQAADQSLVSKTDPSSSVSALRDDILSLVRGFPIDLARCTVHTTTSMPWKDRIGPLGQRPPQKLTPWDTLGPKDFGIVEQMNYIRYLDRKVKIAWIINPLDDPNDVADLAEFLCVASTAKPRGAVNWAARREALGVIEPFDVIWELGNESDGSENSHRFPSFQFYIERCRLMIRAVRSVLPKAKFAAQASSMQGHVYTPEYKAKYGGTWEEFHRTVLRELGDEIDYLTTHTYFGKSSGGYLPGSWWENRQDRIINDIKSITGSDRIKIYNSEYGVWPEKRPGQTTWQQEWYSTHSLAGCLAVGDWIVRNINNPDVAIATMHCFTSGPWGVYKSSYNDETGKTVRCAPFRTGLFDLFTIMKRDIADAVSVAPVRLSGDRTDSRANDGTLTVSCIKTVSGLVLFIINQEPDAEREIVFTAKERYTLDSWRSLSGNKLESVNQDTQKEITVDEHSGKDHAFQKILIPAKSVCVLLLKKR